MSVLKAHRSQSKAEYCNTANAIYVETLGFLSRLSARYSRLLVQDTAHLASEVVTNNVLRLRRLFYAMFGFSCEQYENFKTGGVT